jgi:hypothetical protein
MPIGRRIDSMTTDFPPLARKGLAVACLLIAAGLGIDACLVEHGLVVPLAFVVGIPLACLGGSLLFGHDRDGDKGVIGPVTLYILAGAVTLGTLCGLFAGAHAGLGPGAMVAALLALAASRSKKKKLDLSEARDPRDRNL